MRRRDARVSPRPTPLTPPSPLAPPAERPRARSRVGRQRVFRADLAPPHHPVLRERVRLALPISRLLRGQVRRAGRPLVRVLAPPVARLEPGRHVRHARRRGRRLHRARAARARARDARGWSASPTTCSASCGRARATRKQDSVGAGRRRTAPGTGGRRRGRHDDDGDVRRSVPKADPVWRRCWTWATAARSTRSARSAREMDETQARPSWPGRARREAREARGREAAAVPVHLAGHRYR